METSVVISNRTKMQKLTYLAPNEDGSYVELSTPIVVFGSNGLGIVIDSNDGTVMWDDDNEQIVYFQYATQMGTYSPSPSMSIGDQPMAPVQLMTMPYNEIISMRAVLTKDTFEKCCTEFGISSDAHDAMVHKFFVETNAVYQIKQKQKYSYSNQHSKEYNENRHYKFPENAEYKTTVMARPL